MFIEVSRSNRYTPYPTSGPTIPMETILAPRTESPPWARNRLWNRRTIAHTRAVIQGPKDIVESPVPVGCEQLPVTDGSFNDERMKINPPVTPRRGRASRSLAITFFSWYIPSITQGNAMIHQTRHHCHGKNPSMICMIIQHNFTCFM